jgi:transcriptional antiterminator RfaH
MPDSIARVGFTSKPDSTHPASDPAAAQLRHPHAVERPGLGTSNRWYVAQTHIHAEAKASQHLCRQGFDVYLPRYLKSRRHARRVDRVAAPLFPRYLFVSIDLTTQRWYSINSTIGIAKLLRHGDVPVAVPDPIIEGLKRREDAEGYIQLERQSRFVPVTGYG